MCEQNKTLQLEIKLSEHEKGKLDAISKEIDKNYSDVVRTGVDLLYSKISEGKDTESKLLAFMLCRILEVQTYIISRLGGTKK